MSGRDATAVTTPSGKAPAPAPKPAQVVVQLVVTVRYALRMGDAT